MRVLVSDGRAVPELVRHLAGQGFPATVTGRNELEVLFPAQPTLLTPAAELELWSAQHGGVTVTPVPELGGRG